MASFPSITAANVKFHSALTLTAARQQMPEGMTIARTGFGEVRVSWNVYHLMTLLGCSFALAVERSESIAYYSDDMADAIGTAREIARCPIGWANAV